MENISKLMIQLIGNEVCGSTLSLSSPVSDSDIARMFLVANTHSVAHILGSALLNNDLLAGDKPKNFYRELVYATIYRYENQNYVLEKVCNVLEAEKIPYIPLKGSVIKELYPQPWMRTGCDIDILVHENDVQKATDVITKTLGYEEKGRGKHDVQILSTENIYIELHFSLIEEDVSPAMARVLENAWKHAKPCEDGMSQYRLDDAMFYFYHIAHMAKHFSCGGCGIRPFLDLWLIQNNKNYSSTEAMALLKKARLTDFEKAVTKLSRVWFSGEEHNKVTRIMEEFILTGGCFGSEKTIMLSEQQKAGGRLKHILSRIFIPYDELKAQYPIIKKHKVLTPICEICRIFTLLFGKRKGFRKKYIDNLKDVPDEHLNDIEYLFKKTGLN